MTCDKPQYNTLFDAKKHGDGINRAKGMHFKPYKCPDCGLYHLTSNNKYKKKNRDRKNEQSVGLVKSNTDNTPFIKKSEVLKNDIIKFKPATYTIGEIINLNKKLNENEI